MTLEEAESKFTLSPGTLKKYVALGLVKKPEENGRTEYCETDFNYLGLIDTLLGAGFLPEEIKKYLTLIESGGTDEQQIYMLRKQRRLLLDDIHKKQRFLDNLDYMIWTKKEKENIQ